jgi:type IV pilus assembly protein PilY1
MKKLPLIFALALSVLAGPALAALSVVPPNIISTAQNKPMVMLTASKDYTMFWKAYTDFEDIDFDGVVDYTYKTTFSYYGYFDPDKCYTYDTASDGRFVPYGDVSSLAADAGKHYCTAGTGLWSGNFLNWSTMSRMDVLRKVLYGGLRSYNGATQADRYKNGDTASATTLEQSFVPRNSQAFVKYYNGADIDRVTPFNSTDAKNKGITLCRRAAENTGVSHTALFTPQIRVAIGNVALWNMTEVRTCNWSTEVGYSWKDTTLDFMKSNYVTPIGLTGSADSDYVHKPSVPVESTDGATYTSGSKMGPNFTARVQVCVGGKLEPGCKQYGSVYKPTGLLHEFGESTSSGAEAARAEFGLMMGSYDNNLEAGVLRKNISEVNDEITASTGQFKLTGGIIQSLNEITVYGYNADGGNYSQTCYSDTITNGNCPSWGNPVGELLLESTRYYAGQAAKKTSGAKDKEVGLTNTTWVDPLSSTADNTVINSKLKRFQLYGRGICRPLNMITISGGINSFDNNLITEGFSNITSSTTAQALTKQIGDQEGITGTTRLVGSNGTTSDVQCTPKTVNDLGAVEGICPDGPNFKGTYLGAGVAHFANTQRIRTDKDTIASEIPDLPYNAMTVRNYAVSMSGGTANIEVPMPGDAQCAKAKGGLANAACKRVYITPASLDSLRLPALPGNLVDFKILSSTVDASGFAKGSALVLWQHSMLGEDQDQDQLDSIRWEVGGTTAAPTLTVYTQAIEADTGSGQPYGFGYTITGTDADGLHMHSGINNYPVTTTGVSVSASASKSNSSCPATSGSNPTDKLCSIVKVSNVNTYVRGETYKTFKMTGTSSATLAEPLWYAAKYGGFKYTKDDQDAANGANLYPTRLNQWDRKKENGAPCLGTAADPCDGVPDNYFFARRPDLLSNSLREIMEDIVTSSNTAPAIASSQLQEGDLKVVATFAAGDGSGALRSYALQADGTFAGVGNETWSAHTLLTQTAASARQVITNQAVSGVNAGVAFTWATLSAAKQTILKASSTDAYGQKMLGWLRGDKTYADEFRTRAAASILGPVVNSNPTIQKRPNGRYVGNVFSGYADFVRTWSSRRLLLWVGAGDGMLHAFDGSKTSLGGTPVLSFIPDPVFANLPAYASINGAKVQPFVDGSPFVGDVKVNNSWATYLFSSLGRGGKAIFALDVTKAGTVSTDVNNVATVSGSELDQARAASIFKWQLTDADDADLGYVVSEPTTNRSTNQAGQIAMMNNGRFAALFGNGVESSKGNAALFIVFADGSAAGNGGKYKKLVVPTVSTTACTQPSTPYAGYCNGMGQVTWVDTNNDRVADYIYGGDLKGNLWRFDVTSSDATNWSVSYFQQPLFKAVDASGNALPITGAPEARYHPLGGVMVGFATGAAMYAADFPKTTRTNAMFGIWDNPKFTAANYATSSAMAAALPRGLGSLATRTLVNFNDDDTKRYVTGDAIDWATKKGWVMPFNVSSEMGLNNMTIANSQLLTVSVSPAPAKTGADSDPCTDTPVARLLGVDPVTGLPNGLLGSVEVIDPSKPPLRDSAIPNYMTMLLASIPVADQKGQFVGDLVGRGSTQAGCANGSLACTAYEGATSDGEPVRFATGLSSGRIFWREIPGFKTR